MQDCADSLDPATLEAALQAAIQGGYELPTLTAAALASSPAPYDTEGMTAAQVQAIYEAAGFTFDGPGEGVPVDERCTDYISEEATTTEAVEEATEGEGPGDCDQTFTRTINKGVGFRLGPVTFFSTWNALSGVATMRDRVDAKFVAEMESNASFAAAGKNCKKGKCKKCGYTISAGFGAWWSREIDHTRKVTYGKNAAGTPGWVITVSAHCYASAAITVTKQCVCLD